MASRNAARPAVSASGVARTCARLQKRARRSRHKGALGRRRHAHGCRRGDGLAIVGWGVEPYA
eukprot:15924-Chlamydomonas_euryale.AAC.4